MFEMVVARVNRCSKIQKPPKRHNEARPLKNANFCSSSRKAKILTAGIHGVFRGLKFEPDTEIG